MVSEFRYEQSEQVLKQATRVASGAVAGIHQQSIEQ